MKFNIHNCQFIFALSNVFYLRKGEPYKIILLYRIVSNDSLDVRINYPYINFMFNHLFPTTIYCYILLNIFLPYIYHIRYARSIKHLSCYWNVSRSFVTRSNQFTNANQLLCLQNTRPVIEIHQHTPLYSFHPFFTLKPPSLSPIHSCPFEHTFYSYIQARKWKSARSYEQLDRVKYFLSFLLWINQFHWNLLIQSFLYPLYLSTQININVPCTTPISSQLFEIKISFRKRMHKHRCKNLIT